MKRSVIALAAVALFATAAHAAKPMWNVTAADVGIAALTPGEGTVIAPVADAAPAPTTPQFVVRATASINGEVKGTDIYPYRKFADEASCKAALGGEDTQLVEANASLKARIEAAVPNVEVAFTCVPTE